MSHQALWDLLETAEDPHGPEATITVGSIGYERFKTNEAFAKALADRGFIRLIDVRELPISRKRGFAKTALAAALAEEGIEYRHERALGNPKEFRDLYKAGNPEAGRELYEAFLLNERMDALRGLAPLVADGKAALMCVEHDITVCHRDVIFAALREELGLALAITHVGNGNCG